MKWFVGSVSMLSAALAVFCFVDNTKLEPSRYDKEIRDQITLRMAIVDYLAESYKSDMFWFDSDWSDFVLERNASKIDNFIDKIDSMQNGHDEVLYVDMLKLFAGEYIPKIFTKDKSVSSDGQDAVDKIYNSYEFFILNLKDGSSETREIASGLLKYYRQTDISLTDYVVSSSRDDYKSWTVRELHSGVDFLFEIEDCDTDHPVWDCVPIEQSYSKYVEKQFETLY